MCERGQMARERERGCKRLNRGGGGRVKDHICAGEDMVQDTI